MTKNNNVKGLFFAISSSLLLFGCVQPTPPKIPLNINEVSWAKKKGSASIKGCVSGGYFEKYHNYQVPNGTYDSYPIESSYHDNPSRNFTIDLLPENDYMYNLSEKMKHYYLLHSYHTLNDPRWVESSVMPFIPHISCPADGPNTCPSRGHFNFNNLPAGNWYIVAGYNATKEDNAVAVTVQKITTIDGQTVPFVSWFGVLNKNQCTP
ncbi:hypothetical protein LU298_00255 [Komagataeibacter intermedius]|uniref:carboxypeptidase regulatory-like domain-containing protein n=1 Tax=Komagataeibacter TaxID=1434011 RepID=UPI0003EA4B67|nr:MULTISPECIES: carboxypeptidase regulatory-like domain-containing protein [Komagataeibacter]AHI27242.1 hypothetical protein H845_3341 [Komagataeibacter xylinus E25]ARW18580.1 hypothetical protein S101446_03506 [Komagataeibacter europaeus]MCF3634939.1 hypothetical protein [Komagataeibacter intermedius]SAY47507.1 hypothetical protein KRIGEM_00446 [Komagataeibacter rhaeticus]GBQ16970.1 hypothetical protein AA16663_2564 [Komagataeibacter rhaeticus DSM 16663]